VESWHALVERDTVDIDPRYAPEDLFAEILLFYPGLISYHSTGTLFM
jgi:hypothetical protein